MVEKARRQSALLRLVRRHAVVNQSELVEMLQSAGFPATQTSVSRDLRELGIVKVDGRYRRVAPLPAVGGAEHPASFNELIISIEPVGANLVIVRTRIGAANTVAVEIDRRQSSDISGTIAGDDTVLVAVKSRSSQGRAVALLTQMGSPP